MKRILVALLLLPVPAFGQSDHWAFQAIRSPQPPTVKGDHAPWVRSPIDRFILARLQKLRLVPSPPAARTTLLRRLHLDLIGLPPTPQQVAAFLADKSPRAYERVVDRLLKSPHYGERWGRYWLDVARYADSNGYESDRPRPYAWRWRDWVIQALNRDMPFDKFTTWQIAGDLLPNATLQQKIATGFHRNTLVNTEGGVDREEDRVKRTVDRTNTVGKVWLGITLGCCQCHSHKYDPFTQKEYYQLYAFFNSINEPIILAPLKAKFAAAVAKYKQALQQRDRQLASLVSQIQKYNSPIIAKWEATLPPRQPTWHVVDPMEITSVTDSKFTVLADKSVFVTGLNNREDTYSVRLRTSLKRITAVRLEVLRDKRLPKGGPGRARNGNFVLSGLRVYVIKNGKRERIRLQVGRADFSQSERQVRSVLGDIPKDGWAIWPRTGQNHVAAFELERTIGAGNTDLLIQLDHQTHLDHNIGRFRLSLSNSPTPIVVERAPADISRILNRKRSLRSTAERLRLIRYYEYRGDPELNKIVDTKRQLERNVPKPPAGGSRARIVTESPQPRATHVHVRGSFLTKGEPVSPATPSVLPPLSVAKGRVPNRLDLARWIVSEQNPLTSRVIVNRVWQQYFGRGLVATDDDFGTQGDPPTHPQLLDWLATRFRSDGWQLKRLHKRIVMSATYRQSSHQRRELRQRDPLNQWLARQTRLRVEAEVVRDLALAASGLLSRRIGGPSVRPPQPAGLAKLGFQNSVQWPVSTGSDRYRRGMYTFFQRTVPYPMLIAFDAADSNVSCTRRERSNTPLQALTLWNDPVFGECAQALGRRLADQPAKGRAERLRKGFLIALGRQPAAAELTVLDKHFQSRLKRYQKDKRAAQQVVGSRPGHANLAELAAYTSIARLLINLDEFITRE